MGNCRRRCSRHGGELLLHLLVLLVGNVHVTFGRATATTATATPPSPPSAFVARSSGRLLGTTRHYENQHHHHQNYVGGNSVGSESWRSCDRLGLHERVLQLRRPPPRTLMMAAVGENKEQLQHEQQLQLQQQHKRQHLSEQEQGSLSRASFVQTGVGSAAAVLALSLVSCILFCCTRWVYRGSYYCCTTPASYPVLGIAGLYLSLRVRM